MDIKDLNKTQLILLTLLITFVVSIATGIVTVSLMQQVPKSVPQTINNVIERTIEKVSTPTDSSTNNTTSQKDTGVLSSDQSGLVSIYATPTDTESTVSGDPTVNPAPKPLGQGVIISDVGLVLADSTVLGDSDSFTVMLNNTSFDATVLEKFTNGFTVLKISPSKTTSDSSTPSPSPTQPASTQ